ncbi:hypothetical protein Lgee_1240 [Legionella geestiana]|uniref:Uncharacterized protein n=1 Tax=Legionella geestiana TaxID=45065 RepID=A0A0W0TUZ5_9GAMM|nr:YlbF family regulator [Legionella geestiana]KTC99302.1 hypothetical protein Lgee_1240 [Legionella geestiana]QBS11984.1 hypothetical protein E4T54_04050 [Legionella geestiana]STX53302.1 Uncharacterised protein [Legionella geestiana]
MLVSDAFIAALRSFRDAYVEKKGCHRGMFSNYPDRDYETLQLSLTSALDIIEANRSAFTENALAGMFSIAAHLTMTFNPAFNEGIAEFLQAYHASSRRFCSLVDGRFNVAIETDEDAPLQLKQVKNLQEALQTGQERFEALTEKTRSFQKALAEKEAEIAQLKAELAQMQQLEAQKLVLLQAREQLQKVMETMNAALSVGVPAKTAMRALKVPASLSFHSSPASSVNPEVPAVSETQCSPAASSSSFPPSPSSSSTRSESTVVTPSDAVSQGSVRSSPPKPPAGAHDALFKELLKHRILNQKATAAREEKKTPAP